MDLKPGNVAVDRMDPERSARLLIIDFGVSIRVDSEDATIKGFHGTQPWAAPEVGKPNGIQPDPRGSVGLWTNDDIPQTSFSRWARPTPKGPCLDERPPGGKTIAEGGTEGVR